jgi:hypothetical protein
VSRGPSIILAYQYFHPDENVSARIFTDLAVGLAARGWRVTALTSDKLARDHHAKLPRESEHRGVRIIRVPRPALDPAIPKERLAISLWLTGAWLARLLREEAPDALVVGTDPAFSPVLSVPLSRFWRSTKIVQWCFDMHPESIVADGIVSGQSPLATSAKLTMKTAYRACNAIVDLGPCMRARIARYAPGAAQETITPWALVEPDAPSPVDAAVRETLFANARLGVLYSGTLGRAHDYEGLLGLARQCRSLGGNEVAFAFASAGYGMDRLRAQVTDADTNVRLVAPCSERELEARLATADFHLLSLKPSWTGVVVPSKFFGSLAMGKRILFAGSRESGIATWLQQYSLGYQFDEASAYALAHSLLRATPGDADAVRNQSVYRTHFSRDAGLDRWGALLQKLRSGLASDA